MVRDSNNQSINKFCRPFDNVAMPFAARVKCPWIYADNAHYPSSLTFSLPSFSAVVISVGVSVAISVFGAAVSFSLSISPSIPSSSSPSSLSLICAAETTYSSSVVRIRVTPCVRLPAIRIPATAQRISCTFIGYQHDLIIIFHRERGDNITIAFGNCHIGNATSATVGDTIFKCRAPFAKTVLRDREDKIHLARSSLAEWGWRGIFSNS